MDPLHHSLRLMAGVSLDLDLTLFIQTAFVVVLMILLNKLIFQPYLNTIDAREKRTLSTREQAAELQARVAESTENYEALLESARQRAAALRQELRQAGVDSKDTSIGTAARNATQVMEKAHSDIEAEFAAAREELKSEVGGLSKLVVEKVIGRGA